MQSGVQGRYRTFDCPYCLLNGGMCLRFAIVTETVEMHHDVPNFGPARDLSQLGMPAHRVAAPVMQECSLTAGCTGKAPHHPMHLSYSLPKHILSSHVTCGTYMLASVCRLSRFTFGSGVAACQFFQQQRIGRVRGSSSGRYSKQVQQNNR